jgi:hypothetical protein
MMPGLASTSSILRPCAVGCAKTMAVGGSSWSCCALIINSRNGAAADGARTLFTHVLLEASPSTSAPPPA